MPTMITTSSHDEIVRVSFLRDRRGPCSWLLNIIWIFIAGWHMFVAWTVVGFLLCLTILGIPCGCQVCKIAGFLLCPFGKTIVLPSEHQMRGCNCCCNILWAITAGWILALQQLFTGLLLCFSIIGIPFGWQCFKLAYLCFMPFGLEVTSDELVETVTTVTTRYHILEEGRRGNEAYVVSDAVAVPVSSK